MTKSTVLTNGTGRAIVVVAPATLEEDFTFDVMLGGRHGNRPYTVTVPKGGVKEGEEFEIPYPPSEDIEEGDYEEVGLGNDDDRSDGASTDDDDDDGKMTVPCRSGSSETAAPYGLF
jgi:hypothetical protein